MADDPRGYIGGTQKMNYLTPIAMQEWLHSKIWSLTDNPFPRYEHFSVARFYVMNTTVIVGTQKMIYRNACYPRKVWVQRTVFSQKEKNAAMIMIWAMPQIFLGAIRPLWLVKLFADNIPNIVLN